MKEDGSITGLKQKQTIGSNSQVVSDLASVPTGPNEGKVYRVGSTQYVYVYNAKNF